MRVRSIEHFDCLPGLFEIIGNLQEHLILGLLLVKGQINQLGRIFLGTILLCLLELALKQDLVAEVAPEVGLGFPRDSLFADRLINGFQVDLVRVSGCLGWALILATYANMRRSVELFIFVLLLVRSFSQKSIVSREGLLEGVFEVLGHGAARCHFGCQGTRSNLFV